MCCEQLRLDIEVVSLSLNYALPPHTKVVYVVSVGSAIRDSTPPVLIGAEGALPHETVHLSTGHGLSGIKDAGTRTVSVEVKFKDKKKSSLVSAMAQRGAGASAGVKKKSQPTILTISVFAYPAGEPPPPSLPPALTCHCAALSVT
jgi:hypothetical protein